MQIFSAITSLFSATFESDQSNRWKLGLCSQLLAGMHIICMYTLIL